MLAATLDAKEPLPAAHEPYLWERLAVDDFIAAVKDCEGVCLVPIGCLEKHGYQLPLGTDALVAAEVCRRAASKEKAVVFPFSPFGHVYGVQHKAGTIALKANTLLLLLDNLCDELSRNGLKKIVFLNDHGGNNPLMNHFVRERLGERHDYAVYHVFLGDLCYARKDEIARRAGLAAFPEGGHGDLVETAQVMAMDESLVHMERVVVSETQPLGRLAALDKAGVGVSVGWYADYPHQSAGDPSAATPELGRWILEKNSDDLARIIRLVREDRVTAALLQEYYDACGMPSR